MSYRWNPITGQLDIAGDSAVAVPNPASEKLIKTFEAGETISALNLVYLDSASVIMKATSAGTFETAQAIGVAITSGSPGDDIDVQFYGVLEDAFLAFGANSLLFLNALGAITSSAPTSGFLTRVGYGLGSGSVFLNIEKPIVL